MEIEPTWVIKVEMKDPQAIPEIIAAAAETCTEEDVEHLHRALRDRLPLDSTRRLLNATLETGAIVAFYETSIEPSIDECRNLHRFTAAALQVFRRPRRFNCLKTYPGPHVDVGYLV